MGEVSRLLHYVSVCSGIEAASAAWHPLGWHPLAFAEIELFPCAVLKYHYPTVPKLGDLTRYHEWPELKPDVVVGGTPCQAFSVAGLRKGLADPRGNLTLVFLGLVARMRPRWVVWENVPGVLSDATGAFGSLLGGLGELGYGFAYRVLDAQYFGVAQRRRRVFVVANARSWQRAAAVLFERHSLQGHPAPSRKAGQEVAGTFKARANSGGWNQDVDLAAGGYMRVAYPMHGGMIGRKEQNGPGGSGFGDADEPSYTLTAGEQVRHGVAIGTDCYNGAMTGDVAATIGTPGSSVNASGPTVMQPVAFPWQSALDPIGKSSEVCGTLIKNQTMAVMQAMAFEPGSIARNAGPAGESGLAPTLRREMGDNQPAVRIDMQVRRLTPVECERLQGFPDGYTNIPWRKKPEAPDGPRYKALGNSMAVPVMQWIGERIAAATRREVKP